MQLIAIHLITLHTILEYMQIAIIKTEAADFVKINICVILNTFGHCCTYKGVFLTTPLRIGLNRSGLGLSPTRDPVLHVFPNSLSAPLHSLLSLCPLPII